MTPSDITPEDRKISDKKMKAHARRLKKPDSRLKTLFIGAWCALVMVTALYIAWRWYNQPYAPARTPEMILDDTLQINQRKIPQDTVDWAWAHMLTGPDSGLILVRASSDNRIIAQKRPGQPWEIMDSAEWSRSVAKYAADSILRMFKGRDSL
jgi:hypothetical protein